MDKFDTPVLGHMSRPVYSAQLDERLVDVEERMAGLGVSALPVLDPSGRFAGVISRADLLGAGRVRVVEDTRQRLVTLPDAYVRQHMHQTVEVVGPQEPLRKVAKRMVKHHFHRLFVAADGYPAGVVSTREMMKVIARERVTVPIADMMSTSVVTVQVDEPLALALDRMAAIHRTALLVLDGHWPVGYFSQVDALAARDASPQACVEEWMDPALLCLPAEMPSDRAARAALATRVAMIVAVDSHDIKGVLTGMDFVRLVADAP
jgi:predicted transcriptional regulator